jgi:hypothetical protein
MLTLIDNLPNRESLSVGEAVALTGISQRAILHGELPTYITASSPPTWQTANGASPPQRFVPT